MVNVFTDFTKEFKLDYIVRSSKELELLQKAISAVPIGIIDNFQSTGVELQEDVRARTRFVEAEEAFTGPSSFLDECIYSRDEAAEIVSRIVNPFPVIEFNSRIMSDTYHKTELLRQTFYPAPRGRILTPIIRSAKEEVTNGIIVLWPSQTARGKRNLHYLEIFLDDKYNL